MMYKVTLIKQILVVQCYTVKLKVSKGTLWTQIDIQIYIFCTYRKSKDMGNADKSNRVDAN